MKQIDIVDIKSAIKNGLFRVFISKGIIYLKDMNTEEAVQIGKADKE